MSTATHSTTRPSLNVSAGLKRQAPYAAAVLLALVGTFGVFKTGSTPAPTGPLTLVAANTIPAGTRASELGTFLRLVAVPANARPKDALATLSGVRLLTIEHALVSGETLRRSDLTNPTAAPRPGIAGIPVPAGVVELTVALAPERALAGNLHAGDQVQVLATDPDSTAPARILGPPLTVTGVAGTANQEVSGITLVTFALAPELAPELAAEAARGTLWLASVHTAPVTK